MLVQRLRAIQDIHGFLPDAELHALAKETNTPLYRLQEIISFFPHFRPEWNKPPYVEVKVCRDMACHLRGAPEVLRRLKTLEEAGDHRVEVEGVSCLGRCDRAVACSVSRSAKRRPEQSEEHYLEAKGRDFHDHIYAGHDAEEMEILVAAIVKGNATPRADLDAKHKVDRSAWQIDCYAKKADDTQEFEEYAAVTKLLKESPPLPPQGAKAYHPWLDTLKEAGLLGMGGAGMPAYLKWSAVWKAAAVDGTNEKYIVVNGDESEPSTFKDREILLHMPHLVVEGVILAGMLTNATAGYIFIRHEYGEQIKSVRAAIKRAEQLRMCGTDILGTGRNFTVEVFESPGGYICGEQSALIEAMEDRRAQPRNKPPELMTNGFRNRPTVVNNVETISWTPAIFNRGSQWYLKEGAPGFTGRRFFSLCGDVAKPGVFEVPNGTTLGELIAMAGGMIGGKKLKAVALSGPSGGLLPAKIPLYEDHEKRIDGQYERIRKGLDRRIRELGEKHKTNAEALAKDVAKATADAEAEEAMLRRILGKLLVDKKYFNALELPLDKNYLGGSLTAVAKRDFMLGAGLAVYAEGADVLDHAVKYTEFFRNESCGKCVPCRIGSQKLTEIGTELLARRAKKERISLEDVYKDVDDLNSAIKLTSICGLGQVVGTPLATALVYFGDEIVS